MDADRFEALYADGPPWEIDRPQPAVVELVGSGALAGHVLDVGCGSGANARFLAEQGRSVVGIDFSARAIEQANRRLADAEHLPVRFECRDAREADQLGELFDHALDSAAWHTLGDGRRPGYAAALHRALRPGGELIVIAFSEHEPGSHGPRRVTRSELTAAFANGWRVASIEPTRYVLAELPGWSFSPGGAHAWLARFRRNP